MAIKWMDKLSECAKRERALLASGELPRPRMKNRIQRTAVRFLAAFFSLMLVFTLVSRAADGMTTARVQTDTVKSGVLTDRITIDGRMEPAGDVSISLPEGIRVESVHAKVGQRVSQGDPLLTIDREALEQKRRELGNEIRILELKLQAAANGLSGSDATGVVTAQQALDDAEKDYARLEEKLERNDLRETRDLNELEEDLIDALLDYDKAVAKTRDTLLKEAEEALKLAKEALETAQDSAAEAIAAAKQALEQAQDSDRAADNAYDSAQSALSRAKSRLQSAQSTLDSLLAQDPQDPEAVADARGALAEAQSAYDQAESNADSQSYANTGSSYYARQNLQRTQESWDRTIAKAKEAVEEAQDKLNEAKARTDFSEESPVIAAQSEVDAAQRALKTARRNLEDGVYTKEDQLYEAQRAIETARRNLESAQLKAQQDSRSDAVSQTQAEIDRLSYQYELQKLRGQLGALEEAAANGGVIAAPLEGTVLTIIEKGSKTQGEADVCSLSRSDQGFSFEGSMDQKTAQKLAPGDTGTLSYTSEGKSNQVQVVVTGIGTPDEEGMVAITAQLPAGTYPSGGAGQVTITNRSEKHDACLPLSALRSGTEGDYVLVIREKKTILGTEWVVEKVPVTVRDRDSETMSVESALFWDDRVVVSADKTISEGDRVRLENDA